MDEHLRNAAIARYVYDGLKLVSALGFVAILSDFGAWKMLLYGGIVGLIGHLFLLAALLAALQSGVGLLAAYGMLRRLPWGRPLGVIVNLLELAVFPIGTILGGYSLWVLFQPQTVQLFQERSQPALR